MRIDLNWEYQVGWEVRTTISMPLTTWIRMGHESSHDGRVARGVRKLGH